jgi:hypothetical protein
MTDTPTFQNINTSSWITLYCQVTRRALFLFFPCTGIKPIIRWLKKLFCLLVIYGATPPNPLLRASATQTRKRDRNMCTYLCTYQHLCACAPVGLFECELRVQHRRKRVWLESSGSTQSKTNSTRVSSIDSVHVFGDWIAYVCAVAIIYLSCFGCQVSKSWIGN